MFLIIEGYLFYQVRGQWLEVRSKPSKHYDIICTITKGEITCQYMDRRSHGECTLANQHKMYDDIGSSA